MNPALRSICHCLLVVIFVGLLSTSIVAEETVVTPLTPAQREARLQWWRDAKFGLFIHWGPASLSGKEISWARRGHPFDHVGHEAVDAEVYDNLYKKFNPVKFNADAWMQVAKEAGMKYVVFTTKHHDGFSMWPTKLRPEYSITATPFNRDICKELADAAHQRDLKLGWYYSTRDWTHPDYLQGDNRKYDEFYRGQLRELLSNYGSVDMVWFDHTAGNWMDYDFDKLFGMMYDLQPNLLINDRAAMFIRPTKDKPSPRIAALVQGDYDTPEQKLGTYQTDRAWESCITITECADTGGWSYRPDGRTRDFDECLRMLLSCVTGDGNLLLNIGPMPNGEIVPEQIKVLKQMGQWLAKYGESIYGTRGGPFLPGPWGGSTHKGNTIYLHIQKWDNGLVKLPPIQSKIVSSCVLGGGTATVKQTAKSIEVSVPTSDRQEIDTIVVLTTQDRKPCK